MNKEEAIVRIRNHIEIHKLNEPNAHYINTALEMAINALDNSGCGCSLCLAHNNMQCPILKENK